MSTSHAVAAAYSAWTATAMVEVDLNGFLPDPLLEAFLLLQSQFTP
jgi:hypothetical protein